MANDLEQGVSEPSEHLDSQLEQRLEAGLVEHPAPLDEFPDKTSGAKIQTKKKSNENWLAKLFAPKHDFFLLLRDQSHTTLSGMLALQAYLTTGNPEKKQQVRDLEKFADEQKLHLEKMLSDSFVTPFDREDIYDIAVFLDEIINAAKSTVREMEAMQMNPSDSQFSEMTEILVEGTRCINSSFHHLNKNLNEAYQFAQLARKTENRLGKTYRAAMSQLFAEEDIKVIFKTTEIYRSLLYASVRINTLGEKLLHVIVKMS